MHNGSNAKGPITPTKLLRFLINQGSYSINGFQLQLINYDASVDADAPNKSLTFNVNGPQKETPTLFLGPNWQ